MVPEECGVSASDLDSLALGQRVRYLAHTAPSEGLTSWWNCRRRDPPPAELPVCISEHLLGIEQGAEVVAWRSQIRFGFDGKLIGILSFLEPAKKVIRHPEKLKR